MSKSPIGPTDLEHFEDRVLLHTVDLAGGTAPLGLGEYLPEEAIRERLQDDPALAHDGGDPRHILLDAFSTLRDSGLVDLMEVNGPWGVRPKRRGREHVMEWQKVWQRNRDATVQQAILSELERQRQANPERHELESRIDVDRMVAELDVDHATYLANAEQLRDQGRIDLPFEEASLADGHAYITVMGLAVLEGTDSRRHPAAELERAWNEVARLRRELETIKQSPADLISDPELLRRCADLLTADRDFDRVIREGSVILEDRVRRLTKSQARGSVPVMQTAFSPNKPNALRISKDDQEQTGAMNIYAGVMGLFRNQGGHRLTTDVTRSDALRFVVMLDLLLSMVEKAASARPASASASSQS